MTIGTGYFAKSMKYHKMGYALVSISLKPPWFIHKDIQMVHYSALAPTVGILKLKDNPVEYTKRYESEILSHVSSDSFIEEMKDVSRRMQTDKIALLCYESPEKFCHRHIVARWLSNKIGIHVDEIIAI